MATPCPHCSESIEKLSGFITEDDLKTRLKAKDGENAELRKGLSEAQSQVEGIAGLRAERDALQASAKKTERAGLLRGKVPDDQLDTILASFELLHASAVSGAEEPAEFGDFAAWGATEHPLLKGFLAAPVAGPTKPGVVPVVNGSTEKQAPPPQGRPTAQQLQDRFSSAEFLALPLPERQVEVARLRALTR